jgi:flagellar biosynthesis/type III secretory pathway protein FliH
VKHHERCVWQADYHPYDCPLCKILNEMGNFYTEDELYKMLEDERDEAYAEGENDANYNKDEEIEEAREEGYDQGFEDGKQMVIDSPEDFGLVEDDS